MHGGVYASTSDKDLSASCMGILENYEPESVDTMTFSVISYRVSFITYIVLSSSIEVSTTLYAIRRLL